MRRLLWSLLVAGALAALPAPTAAEAFPVPCVDCREEFVGGDELVSLLFDWCRLLRVVLCPWS